MNNMDFTYIEPYIRIYDIRNCYISYKKSLYKAYIRKVNIKVEKSLYKTLYKIGHLPMIIAAEWNAGASRRGGAEN